MTNDLKGMSRKELEKLLGEVKKALQSAQARDRREAKKAAEKAAMEFGFALHELSDEKPARVNGTKAAKKPKKASKAKFANPENPSQTWTGKGRKPNWFIAATEAGKEPASMEI